MNIEKMMLISAIVACHLAQTFSSIGISVISSRKPEEFFLGIKEREEEQLKNVSD